MEQYNSTRWVFEVIQGGRIIESGETRDLETAASEARWYWSVHSEKGPCTAISRILGEPDGESRLNQLLAESC